MVERKAASLWRDGFGGLLSSAGSTETHHLKSASGSPQIQDLLSMSESLHGGLVGSPLEHWNL